MDNKLIIYLHAQDLTNPFWITDSYSHQGETESLKEAASKRKVIVIVPAEDVLITSIELPKMNRSRTLQALPFAMEEQLIGDVETMHFAAGEYQADGRVPVAVVSREKMQQWKALLKEWHVMPDQLIPETFALPLEATHWVGYVQRMAVVRTGAFSGFTCDADNITEILPIALASAVTIPEEIQINNYTQQQLPIHTNVPIIEKQLKPEQLIQDLAQYAGNTPSINLLQGSFSVKKSTLPQIDLIWKAASYLTAILVFLLFLYPTGSYFILKHRASDLENQVAQIYKSNFPQSASVVAPKLRMQDKLQKLMAGTGENRLLLLLGYVGKGMKSTPSITLKRFDFQNNQLTLELTAASSENFSAFSDDLVKHGLSVKQQNAHLVGSRIDATLLIN